MAKFISVLWSGFTRWFWGRIAVALQPHLPPSASINNCSIYSSGQAPGIHVDSDRNLVIPRGSRVDGQRDHERPLLRKD